MNYYHFEYNNLMTRMINSAWYSVNSLELIEYLTMFEPNPEIGYLWSKDSSIKKILSKINLDYDSNHSGASLGCVICELTRLLKYNYCTNEFIKYLESSNTIDLFKNYNLPFNNYSTDDDNIILILFEQISKLKFNWVISDKHVFLLNVKTKILNQL
jgi:hypothetical protein